MREIHLQNRRSNYAFWIQNNFGGFSFGIDCSQSHFYFVHQESQGQEASRAFWDVLIMAGQLRSSEAGSFGQRTDLATFFIGMGGVPLFCPGPL